RRIRSSGASVIQYSHPEGIGPAVQASLDAVLEVRFPEGSMPDAFTQAARLHASYARERRVLHIGAEPCLSRLDQWMREANAAPVWITGASGAGKSTLIAIWVPTPLAAHPRDIVFDPYRGASPDSADPILLMRRLWEHLNRSTGETVEAPVGTADL